MPISSLQDLISETWHGSHLQSSVSGVGATMQTILTQAAVQNSSIAFAKTWAGLSSPVVMATIGGVISARGNLLQQTRVPILVLNRKCTSLQAKIKISTHPTSCLLPPAAISEVQLITW